MNSRAIPFDELPEYLTPAELRAYLGLSRNTIYGLLRRQEAERELFNEQLAEWKPTAADAEMIASFGSGAMSDAEMTASFDLLVKGLFRP